MRLIDADVVIKEIQKQPWKEGTMLSLAIDWICMLIKNIPAIEIKRGKWTHGINENFRTCSACNISMGLSEGENLSRFKYCPFCGAKMEVNHEPL